jgi:hypothetical protein
MESTDKLNVAKDTIQRWWASKGYPPEFLKFFFNWTLLNLLYNAASDKRDEVNRVLEFGKKYEKLLDDQMLEHATQLVEDECVGDGKEEAPPNSWVKTASVQLRKHLELDQNTICRRCRKNKQKECNAVHLENFQFTKFEAPMRIIYQVRCNLFHGNKSEYEGYQGERNRKLVIASNMILEKVLEKISQ